MLTSLDEGRAMDVVDMHFNKAYDRVLHDELLWEVRSHWIHGQLANYIEN